MVWERFEHPGRQPGPGGMGQAFVRRARGWGDPESFLAPRPNKDHAAIPGKEYKKSPTTGLRRRRDLRTQNRRTEWVAAGPVLLCCMHIMNIDLADYCA